jgi:hypothetical protein
MPLLFRRAGCRISAPSGRFSPGRSRILRMFRMHARAKPLLCRGNRRVRRLSNRAGCIMSDTLCQNEHTPDPVRTSTFRSLILSLVQSFLPSFALPLHGMDLPVLLASAPGLRSSIIARKAVAAIRRGEPPGICIPSPEPAPKNPAPNNVSARRWLQVLTVG